MAKKNHLQLASLHLNEKSIAKPCDRSPIRPQSNQPLGRMLEDPSSKWKMNTSATSRTAYEALQNNPHLSFPKMLLWYLFFSTNCNSPQSSATMGLHPPDASTLLVSARERSSRRVDGGLVLFTAPTDDQRHRFHDAHNRRHCWFCAVLFHNSHVFSV